MEESRKDKQVNWPYVKMPQELLERLHRIAGKKGLIPSKIGRGQNAVKLGALRAIEHLVEQEEKREKRRKENEE